MGEGLRNNVTKCHMGEGGGLKSCKKVSGIIWMAYKIPLNNWGEILSFFYEIRFIGLDPGQ